jgi:hypothetical protein
MAIRISSKGKTRESSSLRFQFGGLERYDRFRGPVQDPQVLTENSVSIDSDNVKRRGPVRFLRLVQRPGDFIVRSRPRS